MKYKQRINSIFKLQFLIGWSSNKFIQSDSSHDWLGINLYLNLKHIFNERFDFKKEVKNWYYFWCWNSQNVIVFLWCLMFATLKHSENLFCVEHEMKATLKYWKHIQFDGI